MTIQESENYRLAVIDSAKTWVLGKTSIDNQMELMIIADHYNINLPACVKHFYCSNNPDHVSASGAFKSIQRVLSQLKAAILKQEKEKKQDDYKENFTRKF